MKEEAFNIARRHSVKNEPDLLQEDMVGDYTSGTTPPSSPYNRKACSALLSQVTYDSPLPQECLSYRDIQLALQRQNSNRENHAIAFQGMHAGEAAKAMAARESGNLHHAQIQRRMTSGKAHPRWW